MARTLKTNSCCDSANEDSALNGFQNHDMKQKRERLGRLMRRGGSGEPSLKCLHEFKSSRIVWILFDEIKWIQW